ncbi:hypothetical protein FKM82_027268 [Ascaphus truei]
MAVQGRERFRGPQVYQVYCGEGYRARSRSGARACRPASACTDTRAVRVHEHEHLMTSRMRRPHDVCVSEAAAWNAQQGEAKCWI